MSGGLTSDETVKINDLTLCHKHSAIGHVRATLPDVCKSPTAPVPYPNIAYARDLEDGTTTVLSHGGAMNGVKGSRFFPSYDDEPGTGGGVKSGVNMHEATWLSWSPNVFMEGRAVTRLTDKMLMNKGNTVSIGGYYTGKPKSASKGLMDLLCSFACECKGDPRGNQKCVRDTLMFGEHMGLWNAYQGVWPEVVFNGTSPKMRSNGTPVTDIPIAGTSRLDVTQLIGGKVTALVEMKFKGDSFFPGQRARYEKIAAANGIELDDIDVERDCKCSGNEDKKPAEDPATKPNYQRGPLPDTLHREQQPEAPPAPAPTPEPAPPVSPPSYPMPRPNPIRPRFRFGMSGPEAIASLGSLT